MLVYFFWGDDILTGRKRGLGNREANHYRTEMPVHEHKQKEKWGKKRKLKPLNLKRKKERNSEKGKGRGTVRKMPRNRNRKRSAHAALCRGRDRTSPWWSWKMCDFDVTGSCDVISPDHFVRGFYYSSYRRCGLNFSVLQKDNKILVHNLSIHEKLEQSTHWNILKKSGKDFTFGSGCTVVALVSYSQIYKVELKICSYCILVLDLKRKGSKHVV